MADRDGGRRPVGRPARIDRRQIAEAALSIGLEHVTMKAVAERLGVSVPGLYHHVRNKSELLRLAAQHTMRTLDLPPDRGQGWEEWLLDYASYVHRALTDEPELVNQLLTGGIGDERHAETLEHVLGVLERHGFSPLEALDTYRVVSQAIVGAAVATISRAAARSAGQPVIAELHRVLARRGDDELPLVREVLEEIDRDHDDPTRLVRIVVEGIASRSRPRS